MKETVLFIKIEKCTHMFSSAFKMQKSTRCMQSMHVRSRLILISVTRGVAVIVQSSVLIILLDVSHFKMSILFVFSVFRGMPLSYP